MLLHKNQASIYKNVFIRCDTVIEGFESLNKKIEETIERKDKETIHMQIFTPPLCRIVTIYFLLKL